MILRCTCAHPQQDALHGAGMRVHNSAKLGKGVRCTVCGRETATGTDDKTAKKKEAKAKAA